MRRNTGLRILVPALAAIGGALAIFALAASTETQDSQIQPEKGSVAFEPSQQWRDYWYSGKAELTGYDLQQARYGAIRSGEAVTIFVTENFSPSQLTKADGLEGPSIPVLKCNFDKKFITGIYPYSMMMTVASPVDINQYPHALKLATSSQEWCGHTYFQGNLRGKNYEWEEHSYFPKEGDQEGKIKAALLEDELWTRLRISPENMPTGKHFLLPGSFYLRLRHQPIELREAELTMKSLDEQSSVYSIKYLDGSRELSIRFDKAFPHGIQGWEETYKDGSGEDAPSLTTKATRKRSIQLDYWSKNGLADTTYRQELGLKP